MLLQALSSVRDLGRLYEIASVLVRYGFSDVVRRIGLVDLLERAGRALHLDDGHPHAHAHLAPAARVRRALEELGPAFVKLGQVLATRVDIFEPEWIAEFSRLHDHAEPVPYDAIRAQLAEDLGAPPEQAFAEFDPVPIAAASLAQVYRARLPGGEPVIVKVRRPGIRPVVEADLRLLLRLAQLAESSNPALRLFRPQEVVREFARTLRSELDFAAEARSARRVAQNFAGYSDADAQEATPASGDALAAAPIILIPHVYWECERVCVQQLVDGIPGTRLDLVERAGIDRALLARRGARAVLKMIVRDGFFHADPHPGNVFYLAGHRIAFIDFGMMGRLPEHRREQVMRLLLGLIRQQTRWVTVVLREWTGREALDEERLAMEIEAFVDQYRGVPLGQLRLGEMLEAAVAVLRQHHLVLPPDLSLLIKTFITLEGMGRELDAEFDMAGEALPVLEQCMRERYSPQVLLQRGWASLHEFISVAGSLPEDLSRIVRAARGGRLRIQVDTPHVERLGRKLDRAASRLTVGLVVAALIIGSSIVMTVPGGPTLLGLPFFGLLGFTGAVIGSLWLLHSIAIGARRTPEDDD